MSEVCTDACVFSLVPSGLLLSVGLLSEEEDRARPD